MAERKPSDGQASQFMEQGDITTSTLPGALKRQLDQAVANYREQISLQGRTPNHVPFREAMQEVANLLTGCLEKLEKIKERYQEKATSWFSDEGGIVFADDDLPESDYDLFFEDEPEAIMASIIEQTKNQLAEVEQTKEELPVRSGGKREDRASKIFFAKVSAIYSQAGGEVNIKGDTFKESYPSPFFSFAKEAATLVGYQPQSDRAFAELLQQATRKTD